MSLTFLYTCTLLGSNWFAKNDSIEQDKYLSFTFDLKNIMKQHKLNIRDKTKT